MSWIGVAETGAASHQWSDYSVLMLLLCSQWVLHITNGSVVEGAFVVLINISNILCTVEHSWGLCLHP